MTAIISQFFLEILQQSTVEKLVKIVYLFINRLGPDYEPDLELGLGETLLIKAISECYGRPTSKIKKDYQLVGDLGIGGPEILDLANPPCLNQQLRCRHSV